MAADGAAHAIERLPLRHPRGVTQILIGRGALAAGADELASWLVGRRVFLVTSPRVWERHGEGLGTLLAAASTVERLTVPDGESAKSLVEAERLWRAMAAAGGKRDSRLLTFGGGSVGDLGGFVAGTFLRGIEYAQLPTTLLAQVDAAIGGKTAIDLPEAKNSVGVFHHPFAVIAETAWLDTLPPRELRAGLAEAVKMAFLLDAPELERLEVDLPALLAGDGAALARVVAGAAAIKARVIESDPEESGPRALLNFGHTLGHAIEAATGYSGLLHGEAVVWGMRFALRLAARRDLPPAAAARLERLLALLAAPPLPAGLDAAELVALMGRDKKAREGAPGGPPDIRWVLPLDVGRGAWGVRVAADEVAAELTTFLAGAAML